MKGQALVALSIITMLSMTHATATTPEKSFSKDQKQPANPTALKYDFMNSSRGGLSGAELEARQYDLTLQSKVMPNVVGRKVSNNAIKLLGSPYKWGGNSELTGMDCSGFARRSYHLSKNIPLPRAAEEMARKLPIIKKNDLKEGDLLFFNTQGSGVSHVAVYLGGGYFAHAPRAGKLARWDTLKNTYWNRRYLGARRPIVEKSEPALKRISSQSRIKAKKPQLNAVK